MRSIREENIMEHSQQVAVIAHALALIDNKMYNGNVDVSKVVLLAQYHEVGEVITGDLPTPIKYFNPEIKSAYKDLEKHACEKILGMLPSELKEVYSEYVMPDETSYEYKLVKYADRLSAYLKCVEERKAGNSEFCEAEEKLLKSIEKNELGEVQIFAKEFLPSFHKTLDQMKK